MGKSSNLPAKMYKSGERTTTRLSFEGSGNATQYIDIGLALSAVNQRHYRSGLYYYVSSIEVYNNENALIDLHTLPDTFATKLGWKYLFEKYMEMNRLAPDTPRGKWHDFRVYMSNLHRTTGTMTPALYDVNASDTSVPIDESHLYSMLTTADDDGDATQEADNFYIHMIGPHVGTAGNWHSVGAIEALNSKRVLATETTGDPVTTGEASTCPVINMFDFSSEEMINDIVSNLELYGDLPPYDRDHYMGTLTGHMQQVGRFATATGVNRVSRGSGFAVPYGLICVDPSGTSTDYRIVVNLVPGSYHGVYAERSI